MVEQRLASERHEPHVLQLLRLRKACPASKNRLVRKKFEASIIECDNRLDTKSEFNGRVHKVKSQWSKTKTHMYSLAWHRCLTTAVSLLQNARWLRPSYSPNMISSKITNDKAQVYQRGEEFGAGPHNHGTTHELSYEKARVIGTLHGCYIYLHR